MVRGHFRFHRRLTTRFRELALPSIAGIKATANRRRDIAAVCRNIAALWPTMTAFDQ
jgi:hypothetical protein